ncbi:MAG: XRE family transcriptional regulator [Acidimicrobiales bacterium]
MSVDDHAPAALGSEIRRRRLDHGLTLVQLAERAELSQPFLSQVENGRAQPSMESLARIAQSLGTTPQSLFAAPAPHDAPLAIVRAGDDPGGPSTYRPLVTGDAPFHVVEFTRLPFEFVEPWVHDGFETVYVIGGRVEIEVDGTLSQLSPGDSVSYDARRPHRHRSLGRKPARLLLVETSARHPHL